MAKTVLITGANGNLGTAVVKCFLELGYQVIAIDRDGSHLPFAMGHEAFELLIMDLNNEAQVNQALVRLLSKYKKIECALLLTGGFESGNMQLTGGEDLQRMYSLNFETAYFMARPLFYNMLEQDYGRIVFVGARPALHPTEGKNAISYALSKALLFTLAEIMNAEAKGKNVVVSMVVPGTIDTKTNRKNMPDADPDNWVKPDQIAEVLGFICSEKSIPLRESIYKIYSKG